MSPTPQVVRFSIAVVWLAAAAAALTAGERKKIFVTSSLDGTSQPSYLILPDDFDSEGSPRPLLVSLHTWSGDVEQRNRELEEEAERRGWVYLFPHFRGPNDSPEACGSVAAQQDILDAVQWTQDNYRIDGDQIYLTGASGGGHMTMLMAGRHPKVWAAASAWVGISDLASWHRLHAESRYGEMLRLSCGGAPGEGAHVDAEYRSRSPLTWLAAAAELPLDLCAGVHDGHRGSVPIRHTLEAFNVVARAASGEEISEQEIEQLSRPDGRLNNPHPGDQLFDETFDRAIYLRRAAGKARVTIFEGGHEAVARAAVEWLSRHVRQAPSGAKRVTPAPAVASEPPSATGPLAHRGLCLEAPENTLAAFRMALDAGFGFELDVWASKDGHAVVIHDATLQRTTNGTGKISEKTLSELKSLDAGSWFDEKFQAERIPTLDEALRLVAEHRRKDLTVALHMKDFSPELLERTVKLVAAHDLFDRTFAFGQPLDATRQMKQFDPRMRTVLADFADPRDFQKPEIFSQVTSETQCNGLWIHFVPTIEQMREARAKEVPIYLYTPSRDPDDWRRGHAAGVIFCSNHVKALTQVVDGDR